MARRRVLLTASGGGHTGFAVAVARYLEGEYDLVFTVARGDEYSMRKIEHSLADYEVLEVTPGRGPSGSLLRAAPRLAKALVESLRGLGRVDAAVCTGHNNGVPPCLAAWLRGARLVSLEDVYRVTVRSRSISLLSRFSRAVALHWEAQRGLYPGKGVVVGPVYEPPRYEPGDEGYILVTAGTYGYEELFDAVLDLYREGRLPAPPIIQTGRVPPDKYREAGVRAFQFDPDLDRLIANARIVVAHQGMTAVTAALGYRKPTIIVYNPKWRLAAPRGDVERVAREMGVSFLGEADKDGLEEALRNVGTPRWRGPEGARRLADLVRDLLTR